MHVYPIAQFLTESTWTLKTTSQVATLSLSKVFESWRKQQEPKSTSLQGLLSVHSLMPLWAPSRVLPWVTRVVSLTTSMSNSTTTFAILGMKRNSIQMWRSGLNLQQMPLQQGTAFPLSSRRGNGLREGGPRYSWVCRQLPVVPEIPNTTSYVEPCKSYYRHPI